MHLAKLEEMDCRVMSFLLLWLVVTVTNAASSPGRWVCPVNSQKLLTDDRVLLPLESITSSSEDGNNPPSNVINSAKWCSAEYTLNIMEEYVGMNFTEPVVITMLVSGGLATSFVKNFSIHHTLSMTESDFQPYGELKSVQDFSVPKITFSDVYFTLETPILAKRFQFRIIEGRIDPFQRICWSLLIHGCKQSEAYRINTEIQQVETTHSSPTAPDTSTNPTTVGTTLGGSSKELILPSARQEGILQKDLLLIVLPLAVVLIIIFLIIVTVGVMICLCYMKSPQLDSPTYESVKLQLGSDRARTIVDGTTTPGSVNLLYDQPRPQFYNIPKTSLPGHSNRGSTSSLGSHMEITNPIYLGQKNIQELTNALCQLPIDDGNDYEDVLGTPMTTLDRESHFKTACKGDFNQPPGMPNGTTTPNLGASHGVGRSLSLDAKANTKYTKVNKVKQEVDDEEGGSNSSPIIKSHYMSTSVAITQELNRLTNELENSLKEQC